MMAKGFVQIPVSEEEESTVVLQICQLWHGPQGFNWITLGRTAENCTYFLGPMFR